MMKKITGFVGKDAERKAMALAKRASPQGRVFQLDDGALVGIGDPIVDRKGNHDQMLYGARGASVWLSEYRRGK